MWATQFCCKSFQYALPHYIIYSYHDCSQAKYQEEEDILKDPAYSIEPMKTKTTIYTWLEQQCHRRNVSGGVLKFEGPFDPTFVTNAFVGLRAEQMPGVDFPEL